MKICFPDRFNKSEKRFKESLEIHNFFNFLTKFLDFTLVNFGKSG